MSIHAYINATRQRVRYAKRLLRFAESHENNQIKNGKHQVIELRRRGRRLSRSCFRLTLNGEANGDRICCSGIFCCFIQANTIKTASATGISIFGL